MTNNMDIVVKLQQFLMDEVRSCSMDFGRVTSLYVYRMWGGSVDLEKIKEAMNVVKRSL